MQIALNRGIRVNLKWRNVAGKYLNQFRVKFAQPHLSLFRRAVLFARNISK